MQTNFIFASVLIPRLIHAKARRSKSAEKKRGVPFAANYTKSPRPQSSTARQF
jgi:hypothetical protein